jgi:hypothetical protein
MNEIVVSCHRSYNFVDLVTSCLGPYMVRGPSVSSLWIRLGSSRLRRKSIYCLIICNCLHRLFLSFGSAKLAAEKHSKIVTLLLCRVFCAFLRLTHIFL